MIESRKLVNVEPAATLQWLRLVYREFGERGGMLRDRTITRDITEVAFGVAMGVNGRTGVCMLPVRYFARMAGYSGNGHDMYAQQRNLLQLGFLTQDGEGGKGGKVPKLLLSVPTKLIPALSEVKNHAYGLLLECLEADTVNVSDLSAGKPAKSKPAPVVVEDDPAPELEPITEAPERSSSMADRFG